MGKMPCDNGVFCDRCDYMDVQKINYTESEVEENGLYKVIAYIDRRYIGVMEVLETYDILEAEDYAWECINTGYYVTIESYSNSTNYSPDILGKLRESYDYIELSDCIDD
jgi:hypothetical protein